MITILRYRYATTESRNNAVFNLAQKRLNSLRARLRIEQVKRGFP